MIGFNPAVEIASLKKAEQYWNSKEGRLCVK